jgi:hypothetical protein
MATFGEYWVNPGLTAYASLADKQYYIVQLSSTAGKVKLATSATSVIIGVVMNDPAAGEPAEVAYNGIVKVAAEASVSIGEYVTSSSTGRAKTSSGEDVVLGRALEASSTAGNYIRVAIGGSWTNLT